MTESDRMEWVGELFEEENNRHPIDEHQVSRPLFAGLAMLLALLGGLFFAIIGKDWFVTTALFLSIILLSVSLIRLDFAAFLLRDYYTLGVVIEQWRSKDSKNSMACFREAVTYTKLYESIRTLSVDAYKCIEVHYTKTEFRAFASFIVLFLSVVSIIAFRLELSAEFITMFCSSLASINIIAVGYFTHRRRKVDDCLDKRFMALLILDARKA